ncbi:emp24/gp25L/p24 family/GOLD-domain-containing protein [Fennellomyces sp. T-0311]|nr:emp24/gp25L/p24 family/GOLD-domain-containing protein [Fennellomyces sp. T-0311]
MRHVCLILLAGLWTLGSAVKFDLPAALPANIENGKRCLSQYVPKGTLVFARVNVGPGYNQRVGMEIVDDAEVPNVYTKKPDISGEITNAFDTRADGEINICFTNTLPEDTGFHEAPEYSRPVEVNFNVGAEAVDFETLAKKEKLGPLELELRKLETVVKEIVSEMTYLKRREARMRDTNESTNERVKWFSLLSLFTLVTLGIWQILYLRRFFRRKRLID